MTIIGVPITSTITLDTYALVGLEEVKSALGMTIVDNDDKLTRLINAASSILEAYCDRNFIVRDYVEYYDGNCEKELVLKRFPINSIASLYDDPSLLWDETTLIDPSYYTYYPEEGMIALLGGISTLAGSSLGAGQGVFNNGARNIKITYNAGFTQIPADLQSIVIDMVIKKYKTLASDRLGVTSASIQGVSQSYTLSDILPDAKLVLDAKYRSRGFSR